ncbi:MAG: hypothetical protein V9G20_24215 [Candidatus Promineifilaceae bacterium]
MRPNSWPPVTPRQRRHAEQRPPLDDAEGDGVVDEEHAHHQSQHTQGGEVQGEGRAHLLDGVATRGRKLQPHPLWQDGPDGDQGRVIVDDEVNVGDAAAHRQHLLRRGNIA